VTLTTARDCGSSSRPSGDEAVAAAAPAHDDRDPPARQRLGDVAHDCERNVEDPHCAGTPDADPPHDKSPDHPPGTRTTTRTPIRIRTPTPSAAVVRVARRTTAMVVAGLGAARHPRLNAELGRAAGPDGQLARREPEPRRSGRPPHDPRPTAQVECDAPGPGADGSRRRGEVPQRDDLHATGPVRTRAGDADSETTGRSRAVPVGRTTRPPSTAQASGAARFTGRSP
jgi:hypothetical protein